MATSTISITLKEVIAEFKQDTLNPPFETNPERLRIRAARSTANYYKILDMIGDLEGSGEIDAGYASSVFLISQNINGGNVDQPAGIAGAVCSQSVQGNFGGTGAQGLPGVAGAQGIQGIQGIPGIPGTSETAYTHSQTIASATWIVTHNLGFHPNVTIVDSGGSKVIGDILYNNTNQITITFSSAFSGNAYLS